MARGAYGTTRGLTTSGGTPWEIDIHMRGQPLRSQSIVVTIGVMAQWGSRLSRWVQAALIVPSAHTRVLDAEHQSEMYEVFHTGALARWGHSVCTPIINVALLALAGELVVVLRTGGGDVALDGMLCAAAIALVCYLAVHGIWAMAMAPVLALALGAAIGLRALLGEHLVIGAAAILLATVLLQTFSHVGEPLPPPWSRTRSFAPTLPALRALSLREFASIALASLVLYPALELWAAPRVWPLQLAHLLGRAGWFRERHERLAKRVAEIHADARNGWPIAE